MNVIPGQDYGVITGDIVGSSNLSPKEREDLLAEILRASDAVRKAFPKEVPLPLGVFRGDGWQVVVNTPRRALRVGVFIRAWLMSRAPEGQHLDTRMAVAIGPLSFVPAGNVLAGDGEAYRLSGRALDALKEPQRLALVWPESAGPLKGALDAFAPVLDAVIQRWTSRQARAVLGRLLGLTQEAIARDWPEEVTRQAIAGHLDRSQWEAVESFLLWLESNL